MFIACLNVLNAKFASPEEKSWQVKLCQAKWMRSWRGYICSAHRASGCPVSQVLAAEDASGDGKGQLGEAKVSTV